MRVLLDENLPRDRFCPLSGHGHGYLPRPFPLGRPRSDLQPSSAGNTTKRLRDLQDAGRYAWLFRRACLGRSPRRRGMQTRNRTSLLAPGSGGNPTGAREPINVEAGRRTRDGPSRKARHSRGKEGNVEELGRSLGVIEPFGQHTECERLDSGDDLVSCRTVAENSGQVRNLRNPATVAFELKLDSETEAHRRTVTHRQAAAQTTRCTRPRSRAGAGERRRYAAQVRTGLTFHLVNRSTARPDPPPRAKEKGPEPTGVDPGP